MKINKEKIEIIVFVIMFLSIVPFVLFSYLGIQSINIYLHRDEYKIGIFKIDSLDCGNGYEPDDFNCYGYGKINNQINTIVNLGKTPGINTISGSYADLNKKEYEVFYRTNGKQTILKNENINLLDSYHYLKKGLFELLFPIVVFPLLILIYKKMKKRKK